MPCPDDESSEKVNNVPGDDGLGAADLGEQHVSPEGLIKVAEDEEKFSETKGIGEFNCHVGSKGIPEVIKCSDDQPKCVKNGSEIRGEDQERNGEVGEVDRSTSNEEEMCPGDAEAEVGTGEAVVEDILNKYLPLIEKGFGDGADQSNEEEDEEANIKAVEGEFHSKGVTGVGENKHVEILMAKEDMGCQEKVAVGNETVIGKEDISQEKMEGEDEISNDMGNVSDDEPDNEDTQVGIVKEDISEEMLPEEQKDPIHENDPQVSKMEDKGSRNLGARIFANIMFGNVDRDGRLEENFLSEESLSHLGGLSTFLGDPVSFVKDLEKELKESVEEDEESFEKAKDAVDFFDITEGLDEDDGFSGNGDDGSHPDREDHNCGQKCVPSPPIVPPLRAESLSFPPDPLAFDKFLSERRRLTKAGGGNLENSNKPLANLRPEKYKNVNVKDLFPAFKENVPLRFSELFPVKESLKPSIWKRLKKRKAREEGGVREEIEENEIEVKKRKRGWAKDYASIKDFEVAECDSVRFHKPAEKMKRIPKVRKAKKTEVKKGPKATDWRRGPAQFWFDLLELPEDCPDYDYGLKVVGHADSVPAAAPLPPSSKITGKVKADNEVGKIVHPPDAFHMVTQLRWEDEVIWNGEEVKQKVLSKLKETKVHSAGWVPSSSTRTANCFTQQRPEIKSELKIRLATMGKRLPEARDHLWYSIFPVDNEELVYGRWEDQIIWDTDNMPKKLEPKIVSLDPNDENIVISIPADIDPATLPDEEPARKVKIVRNHTKESKELLNKAGIISVVEEESSASPSKSNIRDRFYVGNDEFYMRKEPAMKVASEGLVIQHATPSVNLQSPFIPTHLGVIRLRQFHRWPIKRYSHGPLSQYTAFHGVQSLHKHQRKMEKWRTAERQEAGGGDIFLMREARDLSGKDGDLVLMEYIEEYPPLMSFVGMCSKIKNYFKKKPDIHEEQSAKELKYGEHSVVHNSPFLGAMTPGQTMQALENNMYRSPLYEHRLPSTDFVVIRTRNEFSIREASAFFVAGQQCPLYEVPGPNSKRSNNFARDFLQVFIYRLFQQSSERPRRIRMDDIKKAFPNHSESTVRKRLKPCAQFYRTGTNTNWWVMRSNFRLPTEEEIRAMVDPELCAAFYSMAATEQRLKDSGYGEKFILAQEDEETDAEKMDDEIKCAPWHTTRAYVQAMKGKCLMQLTGPADPTGPAQEGFSYVMVPIRPINNQEQEAQPKKLVNGTDADLRKLPLKDAKAILRQSGVPEEEIQKLSRWEVIDVVRTLSTEKVKAGEEGNDSFKFSRGNRFSIAEHQERYREDCQRIFEVQNKVLASDEVLSSDEAESSSDDDEAEEEEEDLDEMGRNIEKMLSNKKTNNQFLMEREEVERQKLHKDMMSLKTDGEDRGKTSAGANSSQVLRITRTFRNQQGREFTRTELVRRSMVIETYVKVRNTKDDTFIRQFASMDDQVKEEMRKEKRRLQEQLRRIKKNQEKERLGIQRKTRKERKEKEKPDLKLKCGACGSVGHMKTNRACSQFKGEYVIEPQNVALTAEDEERQRLSIDVAGANLVNVEGTKMRISEKIVKQNEEMKRRAMLLKFPNGDDLIKLGKRQRPESRDSHSDYLDKRTFLSSKRARGDPMITFSIYLESILQELRSLPEAEAFLCPVNVKAFPKYSEVVKCPMDLQTVRSKVQEKKYSSREDFLSDINQIVENAKLFNGQNSIIALNSKALLDIVVQAFTKAEDQLMGLEKAINPLLGDNDQMALSYILQKVLSDKIMTMAEARPFLRTLDRSENKIIQPMDLEIIMSKVMAHNYQRRGEFIRDVELIYQNSISRNGEDSEVTQMGRVLVDSVLNTLLPFAEHCNKLETNIREGLARSGGPTAKEDSSLMMGNQKRIHGEKLLQSSLEEGADGWEEVEEKKFKVPDESYDPTDFLHSFGQGVFLGPRPSQTVLADGTIIKAEPEETPENGLRDDLAVSDDSEEEENVEREEDDFLAF